MRDWCLGARTLFGEERGDKMHDFQRRLTGHTCPCLHAQPCPILPAPRHDREHHWDQSVAGMDSTTPQALVLRILD